MSDQPSLTGRPQGYWEWRVATGFLWLVVVVLFTPITSTIAWYIERRYPFGLRYLAWFCVSLIWVGVIGRMDGITTPFSWQYWLVSLPLVFVASTAIRGVRMFSRFLKPKTLQEYVEEQEQLARERDARLSQTADSRLAASSEPGWLSLGSKIRGELLPDHLGLRYQREWVQLHESVLDQHLFVMGATGVGKSETIKRLVLEVLAHTDRDVFLVDGKGDEDLANDIRSLAFHMGRGRASVFKLGFDQLGAVYDGFRGQPTDVYSRLCALIGVTQAEGDAEYYADINRDLLQLVCYAPGLEPPRNFEQLRQRLDRKWLEKAYRHDPIEMQTLQEEITKDDILGLARRVRPLAREFSRCVGDDGFALEDCRCAIFSIRVQSVGDTSRRFLDFLVEDLKDFVGKRQQRPAVIIIDEFGQFSNANIISLLTLARSSKLGVILATQDTASLKDDETKRQVLANTRTKILMGTDFPQEVAELAGTIYQVESSVQVDDGQVTGRGSARVQHSFKVDMNEVAKLKQGEAFVIRQRHAIKTRVKAIGQVELIEPQAVETRNQENVVVDPPDEPSGPPRLAGLDPQ